MKMQTSAVTQSMTANTVQFGAHRHSPLSRTALATRSLMSAERLRSEGRPDEYAAALARHFEEFGNAQACPIR